MGQQSPLHGTAAQSHPGNRDCTRRVSNRASPAPYLVRRGDWPIAAGATTAQLSAPAAPVRHTTHPRRCMNPYLEVTGLDATTCAKLLGYSPRLFREWAAGQRPIPRSVAQHISSVLGVNVDALMNPPKQKVDAGAIEPAV